MTKQLGCFGTIIVVFFTVILSPLFILTMCGTTGSMNPINLFDIPEGYLEDAYEYCLPNKKDFSETLAKMISLMDGDDFEDYDSGIIDKIDKEKIDPATIETYKKFIVNVVGGLVGPFEKRTTELVQQEVEMPKRDKDGNLVFEGPTPVMEKVKIDSYTEKWNPQWGIRAFYPIPNDSKYSHYDDYGDERDFKDIKVHEGNDIVGDKGVPIICMESGTIENIGWNEAGGWRIGIRSLDQKRYYYYAHMWKYAAQFVKGQKVEVGQLIGYIGNSGYGPEGTTGKFITHLHLQIEVTYENNVKVWIDPYHLSKFLEKFKVTVESDGTGGVKVKDDYIIRVN